MGKIPPHAKRAFAGVIFDVYQWQQEMFDGTYETFEMLKRPDTAIVIPVTPEGKIIVTREEQPSKQKFIGIPGGRIEHGEDPLEAAERELLEETGLSSPDWRPWFEVSPYSKLEWSIYTFVARNCTQTAQPRLDSGEKISLQQVNFDQFVELATSPDFSETAIRIKVFEALRDPAKMAELRKLLLDE